MSRFDWRHMPGMRAIGLTALVFLYAPLLVLVFYAFNANRIALIWTGFTTHWFARAIANEDLRRTAANSLIVAISATVIATALALPAALALERARFRAKPAADALLALPLVAPEIVTAIATLVLFEAVGLHAGLGNVILAHVVFCVPFALVPMRARLRHLPVDLEDAAADLYGTPAIIFRRVTLPLLAPAIVAGAALAFVVSLDDFLITLLVAPAGATTLPVYLYGMLRLGVTPEANAAATMLLALSSAAVYLAFAVSRTP